MDVKDLLQQLQVEQVDFVQKLFLRLEGGALLVDGKNRQFIRILDQADLNVQKNFSLCYC